MTDFYKLSGAEQCRLLESLARGVLQEWDISANAGIALIKHRENTIFRVTDSATSRSHVLRVHRAGYNSPAEIRSELHWMQALRADGILTPEVIPALDGALIREVRAAYIPEARTVDVFRWIDARELGRIEDGGSGDPETLGKYRIVGATAARLHNHAVAWRLPAGFTRHAWDRDGLLGKQPLWGRYWESALLDAEQCRALGAIRNNGRALLEQFGTAPDRYGLIHADLVPENLMTTGSDVYVIDFDDMGFGWHLFDLATIMYWHLGTEHYQPLFQSVIAGYREHRPFSAEQLHWFPLFLALRGTTYLGWCHTRRETSFAQEMGTWVLGALTGLLSANHEILKGITAGD